MEILQQLAVALGLSALAGVNLYLTVFVTGLAINQHWIRLAEQYHALEILGHPGILAVAGVLYFIEFFADKVPWVDSAWDAVHTAIRPIGAALISIQVLGEPGPVFNVVAALLGGSVALTTHSAKAATRLVVNTSPEPFSNIAVSLAEDAAVFGGLTLLYFNPAIGITLCLLFVLGALYFLPKFWRSTRINLRLLFRKIWMSDPEAEASLDKSLLPARYEAIFPRMNPALETVLWAAPVITRRGPGLPRNVLGWLAAAKTDPHYLYFMTKTGFSPLLRTVDLRHGKVRHETRFLLEEVHLIVPHAKAHFIFGLDRSQHALAKALAAAIEKQIHTSEREGIDRFAASPEETFAPPAESSLEPVSVSTDLAQSAVLEEKPAGV